MRTRCRGARNNTFKYPLRGGTGFLYEGLRRFVEDHLELETPVAHVDPVAKRVHAADGRTWDHDVLLSTMPLNRLVSALDSAPDAVRNAAADGLLWSGSHIVGVGLDRPAESTKNWIYFPEPAVPFYRITYLSDYSPYITPEPDQTVFLTETSRSPHEPEPADTIVQRVIDGLVDCGDGVDPPGRGRGRSRRPVRALVVGGAGYIGSVVAQHLLEAGHVVTVADDLSRGHRWAVPTGAGFRHCDILDADAVATLFTERFDAVLHFAALSLVGESVQRPVHYFRANIAGTLNLLDAMHASGVGRLVFSSTAAVYGDPETVPMNPYGASKLAVDRVIGFQAAATGMDAVSLRYFNVAGASGTQGELHDPETHLVPSVLRVPLGQAASVSIFGTDYPTPDGTAVRDYIHVDDLARAHLLALAATEPGAGRHRVYNLGNGAGYPVREVVEAARLVTGCPIPAVETGRRPGDPAVLVATSDRIRAELGWVPEKPALETMVEDAWHFLRARPAEAA